MLKLLKHDLKNNLKLCIISLFVGLFANGILYIFFDKFRNGIKNINYNTIESILLSLCLIAIVGSSFALLTIIVMIFRRDYYSDRGYLMFTLPVKSNDIILSKLLFAMIWNTIFTISLIVVNFLGMYYLGGDDFIKAVHTLLTNKIVPITAFTYISVILIYLMATLLSYIIMYFSIVATKSIFPSNKTGYVWVVIMIVLNTIISLISIQLFEYFPYSISLTGQGIINFNNVLTDLAVSAENMNVTMDYSTLSKIFGIRISDIIIWTISSIGFYYGSLKLMDNSIDI